MHISDLSANFSSPFICLIFLLMPTVQRSSLFHFVALSFPFFLCGREQHWHSLQTLSAQPEREVAHKHVIELFTYRRQEYVGLCSDSIQTEETQRHGLIAQLQREDLCLSLHVSLQSHLFLSLLFSLTVWNFISFRHFVLYLQQRYITRTKKLSGMLIMCLFFFF